MKAVLPLALVGVLAVGTAYAAGGGSTSMGTGESSGQMGSPSSMSSSSQGHMNTGQIKQMQGKLKEQGYDVGQVDGKMGHGTQQALRQFQQDKGIQATGKPDQQTMAALDMGGQQQGQMPGNRQQLGHGQRSQMRSKASPSGTPDTMGTGGNPGSAGPGGGMQ